MGQQHKDERTETPPLPKAQTGIHGLDDITWGGFPAGRPTLVYGGPGCGKTALAMEVLCRGSAEFGEPGLFVSFEESVPDLTVNFANCAFDLPALVAAHQVRLESVPVPDATATEAGEFTLDGLLVRLSSWLERVQAKRLVLDGLDSLMSRFKSQTTIRHEIARLFRWLRQRNLTTVVTAELGNQGLTRYGLEAYIADCVIFLDHRVQDQIAKRRLRVIKYRGSRHGKDEYPFLISEKGLSILPITTLDLEQQASTERVSSGIAGLDKMLGGKGFYRGSTILVTGVAGTGKSSLAASFAKSICQEGDRCLYLAFEEGAGQVIRNMASIGIDLQTEVDRDRLHIKPIRPSAFGLEEHLVRVHDYVRELGPKAVIMDPITSFTSVGAEHEVKAMLIRLLDYLKVHGITVILPSLTPGSGTSEETETMVSSLTDAWIVIKFQRTGGTRRREIFIHKARGLDHSEELFELQLSRSGPEIQPIRLS